MDRHIIFWKRDLRDMVFGPCDYDAANELWQAVTEDFALLELMGADPDLSVKIMFFAELIVRLTMPGAPEWRHVELPLPLSGNKTVDSAAASMLRIRMESMS